MLETTNGIYEGPVFWSQRDGSIYIRADSTGMDRGSGVVLTREMVECIRSVLMAGHKCMLPCNCPGDVECQCWKDGYEAAQEDVNDWHNPEPPIRE